ncbi:MAG: BamA/TamA family outer membrane protein [Odoribacteraceae bacterium]|jgi:outer membrane protein assembly factor BamA|nr:BamA/TamA family outer membrane protein [Odoribacteraceae bacterium]
METPNKITFFLLIALFTYSCSPMKYVGEKEFLLDRVRVKSDSRELQRADLKKTIRQKPNTRILASARFHLWMYNLSGSDSTKRLNRWLRSIGEPPVIYSPFLAGRSVRQMELMLLNKGYYQATVSDSVRVKRRRASVEYRVHAGARTSIAELSFRNRERNDANRVAERTGLLDVYYRDTTATVLHPGQPLDMDLLDGERERVTQTLREKGYFNFSKNFVQFLADSAGGEHAVNLAVRLADNTSDTSLFRRYFVRDIRIDMDYDQLAMMSGADTVTNRLDYRGYTITYRDKLKINPKVIVETIQINRNELYNIRQVLETYSRLQALNLFRLVSIEFKEVDGGEHLVRPLDCTIRLTPLKRQSYNVAVEGTNTSGNLGIGGNFTYNHRNLFRGGEDFSIGIWGAIKKEQLRETEGIFNTREIGSEIKFVTPQFWMPLFRMKNFRRDYAPRTTISFSYGFEDTPYYRRSIVNARFGYLWRKADKKWRYGLNIADLNYVLMDNVESSFIDSLKNEYIKSAYTDHMILSAVFSATYTDQLLSSREKSSYNYLRVNVESAGNLLRALNSIDGHPGRNSPVDVYYKFLGVRYAQFIKMDAEYRYHWHVNDLNSLVWRFMIGCGYPYGNMKVLPVEEAYYCGGANDLRAWQARTLGPGTFVTPDASRRWYPNSVGDFKLAANVEQRFALFWLLEGAFFIDAGNVWNVYSKEDRAGSRLSSSFLRQIAIGTGAGLRLNANYFLLRFDLGIKLKDPTRPVGDRFVLLNRNGGFRRSVFNIAIGYPF